MSDLGTAVAVDPTGGVVVAGYTYGALSGSNAGGIDTVLRKYNTSGMVQWTVQFGSTADDYGTSVGVDGSGNVYAGGYTSGALVGNNAGSWDGFVRKYNSTGVYQWTQQFGTTSADQIQGLTVETGGNVYVTGFSSGVLGSGNAGGVDGYVRKYNSAGAHQWTQQFGTALDDYGMGIAVGPSGVVYASGRTYGAFSGTNAGGSDAFVRKYDGAGVYHWTQQFGTASSDEAYGVGVDGSGNVYPGGYTGGALVGTSFGGNDAFVRQILGG